MSAITSPSNHITTSTQSHASADSSCSRPSSSATSKHSATSSSSSSACAACKYQRRKCEPECPLAPYFPADNQRQFLNVHRLFGVSNLQKILKSVHSDYHHDAMRSVILQANIRAQDPVGGCQRQIINLTHHINDALVELMNVRKKIAEVKAQLDASSSINPNLQLLPSPDVSLAYNNQNQLQLQLQQQYYNNNHLYDPLLQEVVQEPQDLGSQNPVQFDINVNAGGLQMEQQPFPPQMLTLHPHNPKDEEDAALAALPFSYKNEAYVDSNLLMQVQEHELKSAASLFTLTNDSRSTI